MRVYQLPPNPTVLLFDIDNTLYNNEAYVNAQVDLLVQRFAEEMRISKKEARERLDEARVAYRREHDGASTSTGNLMRMLGIPISVSVRWREELFEPADWLSGDADLARALQTLHGRGYRMGAVTNNPVLVGHKVLRALGAEEWIGHIVGLDTCMVSKPAREPFEAALSLLKCTPRRAVSVGDRYDVDLAVPLEMGMGGVLVESPADIYELPTVLPAVADRGT